MLRTRLLSTSTFRLTLLYLGTFSLSAVALLIGIYFTSVSFMERQTLETINVEIEGLLDQYRYQGFQGLAEVIAQRAATEPDRTSIYLLLDQDYKVRAGNLGALPPRQGSGDDIWRFPIEVTSYSGRRATHQAIARLLEIDSRAYLLVGRDVEDKVHTQQLLRLAIAIGSALMLVLGVAGGYVMSRWMLNRLDVINRTTARIMAGELTRRIEVSDTDDEFDELGRNLNAMLDRIGRLLTGMRQVTDDIAHDLRTPLNRLRSRIEVALMGEPGPHETRELLEATLRDADGLIDTFNALLNIARAETGALRSEYERIDVAELARDVYELYEPLAEQKGITLVLDAPEPVQVDGHRQLLAQAIANVTDNAVKYTPAGGRVTVRTSAQPQPEVTVLDNGPGIPADQRERAKKRFVRLEANRGSQGSGLGLSLVEAVAKLHDARFELSDAGPGLVVSLVLPPARPMPFRAKRPERRSVLPGMASATSRAAVNPAVPSSGLGSFTAAAIRGRPS